jgi:3-isopropylmalate/(R)-2-methylmalate dehydratase small subunit
VDLETCTLTLPGGNTIPFAVPPFARHCLLNGIDEMQFLLGAASEVDAYEARQPASIDTTAPTAGAAS